MFSLLGELLNLIFPILQECPLCRRSGLPEVCAGCRALLEKQRRAGFCDCCGRFLQVGSADKKAGHSGGFGCTAGVSGRSLSLGAGPILCPECRGGGRPFTLVRAAGLYEGPLREALHRFKYGGRRSLAVPLASLLLELLNGLEFVQAGLLLPVPAGVKGAAGSSGTANWVIVPVPLSTGRLRERGFNQAALLARELSRRLGVPAAERVLVKSRDTAPQVGLSRREREVNLASAFAAPDAGVVKGKNILLIDDVLTTGSTLSAASSVLLRAGSEQVFGLVLAAGWLI